MPIRAIHYSILVSGSLILSAFPALAMEKDTAMEKTVSVEKNTAAEKICAIYPHLKDSYWLSVNYGMVEEAKKQQVELKVLESGGYPNIARQTQQIQECRSWGAQAIILGTVSPSAYQNNLSLLVQGIPVFQTVNQLNTNAETKNSVHGYVGVNWYNMGYETGNYLKGMHPKGSGKVRIAWLPGPKQRGGTKPVEQGFLDAIKESDVEVAVSMWEDNDKELQRNLVQHVLEATDIEYIVGSAVAIEAAISEVRIAERKDVKLVATYLSHGIYRGLRRGRVEFAPTDKMVLQGKTSIMQATYFLRGQAYNSVYVPIIEPLTAGDVPKEIVVDSLSPAEYRPVYMWSPTPNAN
ncbi:TMAO reductase system periplasmic protein TorT [Vibrio penaeicida]|uniref:TMAO reductase system periplasmic protein TorT n=1 Tax=Vibrio penaeicida TaxID=104609 RepID=UPI00352A6E4C